MKAQSPDLNASQESVREATERAERAEAELAQLKAETQQDPEVQAQSSSPSTGEPALRNDSMMAHLLDSLRGGKNIGHYGRLVLTMVARHFLHHDQLLTLLTRDPE